MKALNIGVLAFDGANNSKFPLPILDEIPTEIPKECLSQRFRLYSEPQKTIELYKEVSPIELQLYSCDITHIASNNCLVYLAIIATTSTIQLWVYCDKSHCGVLPVSFNITNETTNR